MVWRRKFNDTPPAAPVGGTTDLETMNLQFGGAYRLNEGTGFRPRLRAVCARAEIERFAGRFRPDWSRHRIRRWRRSRIRIPSDTKICHLNGGNQWGFGWNAGIAMSG